MKLALTTLNEVGDLQRLVKPTKNLYALPTGAVACGLSFLSWKTTGHQIRGLVMIGGSRGRQCDKGNMIVSSKRK